MKNLISSILLSLFTVTAFAGINVYDELDQFKRNLSTSPCIRSISKMKKSDFRIKEIEEKTMALSDFSDTRLFYHYTNASSMLNILNANEPDREIAQSLIERDEGLQQILRFSYLSMGLNLAGRGFYLASDPVSSLVYGRTQVTLKLAPETRIYENSLTNFDKLLESFAAAKGLQSCMDSFDLKVESLFKTIVLQESGVDFFFYDQGHNWFMLVNEDMVQKTMVLQGVNSFGDLYVKMAEVNRGSELRDFKRNLSLGCSDPVGACQSRIFQALIKHNDPDALIKFLENNYDWKTYEKDVSLAFGQYLKAGNTNMADAFLISGCSLKMTSNLTLAEYLVDKAPKGKGKLAEARKQAVCQ